MLPIYLLFVSLDEKFTRPDEIMYPIVTFSVWTTVGIVLIQVAFWEKCFAHIVISDEMIEWRCPLRRTRRLPLSECIEINAFLEHENDGIPVEEVYFTNCRIQDLPNIRKQMRTNNKIIVFWYSEELYGYLRRNIDSDKTRRLVAYRTLQHRSH